VSEEIAMQTQSEPRLRKRLHCTLSDDARRHNGLILNLSQRGLFVQTNMPAEPGTLLSIDVHDPIRGEEIPIRAAVVWRRRVPARMKGTNESGMGLRLVSRPDAWQQMMSGMLEPTPAQPDAVASSAEPSTKRVTKPSAKPSTKPSTKPRESAPVVDPAPVCTFVVRLAQPGGPRSRRLWVQATSEQAAREEAIARAGVGWTILELSRR
jgi:Tfp pilus assembly protein PilZ